MIDNKIRHMINDIIQINKCIKNIVDPKTAGQHIVWIRLDVGCWALCIMGSNGGAGSYGGAGCYGGAGSYGGAGGSYGGAGTYGGYFEALSYGGGLERRLAACGRAA